MKLDYPPGATPLDPDETQGLRPTHITLQHQLNDFEQANMAKAREWGYTRRRGDPLDREFIRTAHRRMFDATWLWAGEFRRSDKNIGAPWTEVAMRIYQLAGNGRHARFMADLLLKDLTGSVFTWGQGTLGGAGEARANYLQALRAADAGHYTPLLTFLGR